MHYLYPTSVPLDRYRAAGAAVFLGMTSTRGLTERAIQFTVLAVR